MKLDWVGNSDDKAQPLRWYWWLVIVLVLIAALVCGAELALEKW